MFGPNILKKEEEEAFLARLTVKNITVIKQIQVTQKKKKKKKAQISSIKISPRL